MKIQQNVLPVNNGLFSGAKKLLMVLVLGAGLIGCNTNSKTPEQIKQELPKQIPGLSKVDAVTKSPVNGIYEVVVGRKVFYVTDDGKYMFFGNLIDAPNKRSLTEERTRELSKIDPKLLPLDLAIKEVNGSGKRILYVFSDPECPYCQMFEKQVAPLLTDTTIYTFLFPLPMHPKAKPDAEKIWCSKDRSKVWVDWMRNKVALPQDSNCDTSALDKIYKLGTDLVQVEGTPTLILSDGEILSGGMPADQLLQQMDQAAGIKSSIADSSPQNDVASASK